MSQQAVCSHCQHQPENPCPHEELREISKLPGESALYICQACRNLWLSDFETGWQLAKRKDRIDSQY